MSTYHRHAQMFRPEPQRPICYRTHRTLLQRLRPLLLGLVAFAAVALFIAAVAAIAARMHTTQVQLDAAYLAGMSAGQRICGAR